MKRLALVTLLCISLFSHAQSIKGKVVDNLGNIAFADIILKDNSGKIIAGTNSNDEGVFLLKSPKGEYTVVISFLGYTNWTKQISVTNTTIDLGIITLVEDTENLEEVVIQSKRRVIQQKVDRLIFDVEKSVVAEGGNGVDILNVAPRVQIQNGVLEILGKGPSRVLINGRLSPLEGEELTAFLEGLNANDIKTIEVITTPPAKFEAAGRGGLINIILKRSKLNSWNNTSRVVYNQNEYNFGSLRNNFSYNKNKLSLVASINATKGHFRHTEDLQIQYPQNFWDIAIESKERNENYSGRFQLDYQASEKTTLGMQYLGNITKPGGFTTVTSTVFDENNQLDRWIDNKGDNNIDRRNNAINFHAETKLDTLGRSIAIDADYFNYNSKNNRDFTTEVFGSNGDSMGITSAALNISDQDIENYSSKVDVNYPINKVNLSFGGKVSFTNTKSDILFFDTLSGDQVLDPSRSNNFEYQENNLAAYVSAATSLTAKLELKLGVRLENTNTKGISEQANQEIENEFTKLFPTVYASYTKNDNHTFSFSYGRRIDRPRFSDLNPFRYYINDNSFGEGNPFLQPSFTDSFELSHTYKRKLSSNVFLNVTTDGFGVIFTSDPVAQTQIVTRDNYITQYNYGISENYNANLFSWWESQNSFNILGYYSKFQKDIGATPRNGVQVRVSSNNTFSIAKKSKLLMNSWYSSAYNGGLFSVGEMYSVSLGFQHSFKNNIKLSVFANDIFNTSALNNLTSIVDGVEQVYGQNDSNRNVRISLSYSFGNKKIKVRDRKFGNDDERRRSN
ncbi:TonB-dependent receptor domain-containing protein [Tenacibaculum agarivorans]|uniref:TonB-dependent receptor domain-containing protein n=1 Tax=Tenacibaculum agarivorans TaxID=1908389 RepID=UPI00094B7C0C|nr:outer membrane beta-barrel family protein [Tenacibaculum agarivorans]